jgi:tetratricopeptide (TPR) repeat protein
MFYPWLVLSYLLSNPLLAGIAVLAVWLVADRAWYRRTGPWQWLKRHQGIAKLRVRLDVNPHDRDARFQLAELLVDREENDEALSLLEKNVDAGDSDVETLWLAGKAAYGSSRADARELGERYLGMAAQEKPSFRSGAIDLELGRGRLRHGRYDEAREALARAIAARPGSVEVHVLLARTHAGSGEVEAVRAARRKAWQVYREAPRFKRRQDRTWAWKAKPSAAVAHYATLSCVVGVLVAVLPSLVPSYEQDFDFAAAVQQQPEEGWNVPVSSAAPASRFSVTPTPAGHYDGGGLSRWDLNENGQVDLRRKLLVGDLWCRIVMHFPAAADRWEDATFLVEDTESGARFGVAPQLVSYYPIGASGPAATAWKASVLAFESLLESEEVADCEVEMVEEGITMSLGVRDGRAFHTVRY